MAPNTGAKSSRWVSAPFPFPFPAARAISYSRSHPHTLHAPAQRVRRPRHRRCARADQALRRDAHAVRQGLQAHHPRRGRHDDHRRAGRSEARDRAIHEERPVLHHLQLRQQDHARDPEPLHEVPVLAAAQGGGGEAAGDGGGG